MPRRQTPVLTSSELEFMGVIWKHGPCTAVEVRRRIQDRELAESTVRTTLQILERKGYLEHSVDGRTYVYRARVTQQQTRKRFLNDVLRRVFEGSPELLVRGLIDMKSLSAKEVDRIKRLLDSPNQGEE